MSGVNITEGVQVVKLGSGENRYQLDEEALKQVLLRPDVRDRPVVVVSVAGAYRGGKSFLLDFFLRYLNAPRSSQLNGEWLGKEDEPLQGFHWRGGGERDTTGINLWPHPILTTLESTGEKVAVLLMDTQGTFDTETTIGQNSTIFALSTLLSSVQVYNLSGNIREDDLQHLQLFTEYGKLACDGNEKAFQTLTFLVRDWMSDYEHAHGFSGGAELLNKRLEFKPNQKGELREVREHIRSCFDTIKCFLMPHPGLNVANKSFAGCLRDVTEKFRLALLELVPSFFDPQHLIPKLINGEKIKARDLFEYFQKYVDIFNSDEIPEAVTIFKATAEACMMSAVREARELYAAHMEARLCGDVSVAARALAGWHVAARAQAEQCYCGKRKLGAQTDVDFHLEELRKDLDARHSLYMWNNDAKVRETLSASKKAYEDAVSAVSEVRARLCLHPLDLRDLHADALTVAITLFDTARHVPEDEEDDERFSLLQTLEQQYEHLNAVNEQNNKSAVMEARDMYVTRMKQLMDQAGVSSELLQSQHQGALDAAQKLLRNKRNRASKREDDPYVEQLLEEIIDCFTDFEKLNMNSNKVAMQGAEYAYNNYMSSAWGPQSCCFHPRALEKLHIKAKEVTLKEFLANRTNSHEDDYKEKLIEILQNRYSELETINEFNNNQAVEQAFGLYTRKMDKHTQPSLVSILVAPFFIKLLAFLPGYHEKSKRAARQEFNDKRRGDAYDDDEYYENLMKKIDSAYVQYRNPVLAILRELGLPTE